MRRIRALSENISRVFVGQELAVELAVICFLSRGHLLIEDVPGVGKTLLATTFARSLGLETKRVQFTSDLLPSDILGVNIYDPKDLEFKFHEGPIFTNILLADEVNRAEPRAQSALLEAMFERQVSLDGETRALPEPFMVIATQNPVDFSGTFQLPDSQLDRFLFRISLGYPDMESERSILRMSRRGGLVEAVLTREDIFELFSSVDSVQVCEEILDYILYVVHGTRRHSQIVQGGSTRAMIDLVTASKARAFVHGRSFVLPDDVEALSVVGLSHRIRMSPNASVDAGSAILSILKGWQG